jgi:hypothetical protein
MDGHPHRFSTDFEQTLSVYLLFLQEQIKGIIIVGIWHGGVLGVHESLWERDLFW